MKTAVLFLALMPFVFSAHVVQDRFIESLLGGYDRLKFLHIPSLQPLHHWVGNRDPKHQHGNSISM
ncbi:hypothetical protein MAR_029937 [Mya arenaria]|uniref:Uncharacterized protein n=1 Tax=Mya arenaria TaxID=6604 RepID=A0ABY7DKM3_MYAAR|nr:hypothetical protein MAR_029884 [Mya arenaria]WAQ97247.1 hypothetical protein MAR_029937 [Mya arenaria]